jgi:hypothetical protein
MFRTGFDLDDHSSSLGRRGPSALLTQMVSADAKKKTAMVSHDFHMKRLSSSSPQIIVRDRTVPAMMQTMQMLKQILLS